MAGLTKMQKIELKKVKRMRNVSLSTKEYYVLMGNGPFLIQCLYEAQDVQTCKSVFGLTHKLSGLSRTDYDLYAYGYCISACSNAWDL